MNSAVQCGPHPILDGSSKSWHTFHEDMLNQLASTSFSYSSVLHKILDEPDIKKDGIILEFGVATGHTIKLIHEKCPHALIIGFDSFEGLPEDWRPGKPKGTFSTESRIPVLPPGIVISKGLFADTIPKILKVLKNSKVDLIHVDCDIYSSTSTILQLLSHNIKDGTYIVFDELLNYPSYEEHEMKALHEFTVANPEKKLQVIGMIGVPGNGSQQAAIRIF